MTPPSERVLDLCVFCPDLCLDVCPVSRATGNSAWSPWGKMSLLRELDRGLVPADDASLGALYECVGCLACTDLCEHSQPVAETLFEARGRHPRPDRTTPRSTPDLAAIAARVVPPDVREDGALAMLLPGREVLESRPGAVTAAFVALSALGADGVAFTGASLQDDGSVTRAAGDLAGGLKAAVALAQKVSRYKRVVVMGAHAWHSLAVWLPTQGRATTAHVVPLVEELATRLDRWPDEPREPDPRRVAVHDACLLARGSHNAADALRRVVTRAAGKAPLELAHTGRNAWCCGRGALYHDVRPDHADAIARLAIDEARQVGAELLVCGCAASATAFERAGFPAIDVAEYVAERLSATAPSTTR